MRKSNRRKPKSLKRVGKFKNKKNMKSAFKKLNEGLFNNSTLKVEKLSAIRGGRICKITTHHNDHTHSDYIENDDDMRG